MVATHPEAASSLAQELNQDSKSSRSGTNSDSSLGRVSPNLSPSSTRPSSTTPSFHGNANPNQLASGNITSNEIENDASARRFLLVLVDAGAHDTRLVQVEITKTLSDLHLMQQIRQAYFSIRSCYHYRFTLLHPKTVDVVKV